MTVFESPFATQAARAVSLMCDAIAAEDPTTRVALLKHADLALGKAMNEAETPDESGMIVQLTKHLTDMKGRGPDGS